MDLRLNGKVALVTGSSKGIGYAIAERLAEEGARVALCARTEEDLASAAERIEAATGTAPFWRVCDMTDPDDVSGLVAATLETFGRLDVLVANTGGPSRGEFEAYSDDDWRAAFDRSVLGMVRLVREVLPILREQGSGSILTITSSSARQPIAGHWLSNTLRPGVWGLVKTLADDLAPQGIRVNNIAPGRILTERVLAADRRRAEAQGVSLEQAQAKQLTRAPIGRFGQPGEIADAAAYLVSDRASYITGVTLHVDGGMVRGL